ncbi:hypothetical protein TWF506_010088 [Arthrobotrys conoides]
MKDIIDFVCDANKLNSKRASRRYGDRIQPLLNALHQFTGTVDVMIQSNPEISSLVWGTVRFFMTIAMAHNSYFESISNFLNDIGKLCPLIEKFNDLLPDPDLQDAVCRFYSIVINLFTKIVAVFQKKGFKAFIKATLGSLKGEFKEFEVQLERNRAYVDGYIRLASERAHHRDRQSGAHFRSQVIDYTVTSVSQWNQSTDWRIQQDFLYIRTRRKVLLEKITGHNYYDLYYRHLSKSQQGTGNWIFNFIDFKSWESTPSVKPILWCSGIPGSGKSVLTASITKHLIEKHSKVTAFFFCDFEQKSSLQWETIFRSLLRQLLSISTHPDVDKLLEKFENPVSPYEVVKTLQQLLEKSDPCYLVFDGIDECGESDKYQLLQLFEQLLQLNPGKVKILVSSRHSADVSRSIVKEQVQEINIVKHVGPDIEKYIEAELHERIRNRRLIVTSEMLKEIRIALTEKAEGMFLYVRFQLDDICTAITENALRECLDALPRGLDETYNRILSKIEKFQDLRTATKVFNWVIAVSSPLTVEELAEACAFEPGDKQHSDGRFATDDWKIIFNCNNLMTVERRDGKDFVHFAHATILDHLRGKGIVVDKIANQYAACICLTYLNFTDFERQLTRYVPNQPVYIQNPKDWVPTIISPSQNVSSTAKVVHAVSKINNLAGESKTAAPIDLRSLQAQFKSFSSEFKGLGKKYKFLEYARKNWIEHCRFISKADECWSLLLKTVGKNTLPFKHLPWDDDAQAQDTTEQKDIKFKKIVITTSDCIPIEWALRCQHIPLLESLQSIIDDPQKWDLIMRLPVHDGKIIFTRDTKLKNWNSYFRENIDLGDWRNIRSRYPRATKPKEDTLLMSLYRYSIAHNLHLEITSLLQSCPGFGIPLIIIQGDTTVLSLFCQEGLNFDLQQKIFLYGPMLLDTLGLVMAILHEKKYHYKQPQDHRNIKDATVAAAEMIDTILRSRLLSKTYGAFELNEPAFALKEEPTDPQKNPLPDYLEWALEMDLGKAIADLLVKNGAVVRRRQAPQPQQVEVPSDEIT